MDKQIYDIIIIGCGLSGLYSAYKIKNENPLTKILILDKESKNWIGGRTGEKIFDGVMVPTGAGVGRKKKDFLLIKLLNELNISYKDCEIKMNYAKTIKTPLNINKTISYLKKEYNKYKNPPKINFEKLAKSKLPINLYNSFLNSAGYTDFENEDIYEVLFNYGMDDNYPGWISLIIPWKQLIDKLIKFIGSKNILSNNEVIKIHKIKNNNNNDLIYEILTQYNSYFSHKVIVATTIHSLKNLFPKHTIYNEIKGQPFLRIYGKFSTSSKELMKMYVPYQTLVPGPLHKIIPIDLKKGIFMIAYTDNKGALYLKKYLENINENRLFFERLLEQSLGIPNNSLKLLEIKGFYWPIGTHYYIPLINYKSRQMFLEEAQHPDPNILVVGEVVSINQGWTEGALESVNKVLNKKWIKKMD